MAKSNIDEEKLRESVARGIPQSMGYPPPEYGKVDNTPPPKRESRKSIIKSQHEEYVATYLNKRDLPDRQLMYVSKETHKRLANVVQVVGGYGVTLTSYVDNIVRRHLDDNKELINGLMRANLEYLAE